MALQLTPVEAHPEFDLYYYLEVSGDNRLEQETLSRLEEAWNRWTAHVQAFELKGGEGGKKAKSYWLAFLDKPVEEEVDKVWNDSPTDGLALQNLAVVMVMSAAASAVPELAEGGCAPLPEPTIDLVQALKQAGLNFSDEGTVNRKYAVLTPKPYQGGCDICYLQEKCPKSQVKDF